jgi:glycosyltransferase involved in cell wall biosynthesis
VVKECGEKARQRALSNYSWDAVVSRYETLLASLVARSQATAPSPQTSSSVG